MALLGEEEIICVTVFYPTLPWAPLWHLSGEDEGMTEETSSRNRGGGTVINPNERKGEGMHRACRREGVLPWVLVADLPTTDCVMACSPLSLSLLAGSEPGDL